MGMTALMSIQALLERASPKAEFVRAVCKQLLFDFELWQRSAYPARLGHVRVVSRLIQDHPSFFRRHYGVQYVLDLLRPSLREHSQAPSRQNSSAIFLTRNIASQKTHAEETRSLQDAALDLLSSYLKEGVDGPESIALQRFLLASEDLDRSLLMLQFIRNRLEAGLSKTAFIP